MDNTTHELKTWPDEFEAVKCGLKTFEYRIDDRGFKVGDYLCLKEYNPATSHYSGYEIICKIIYILRDKFELPKDHVVMQIEILDEQ